MRLEYAAGERMFVDFAGDTVPVTDSETGEIWNAQVFVSVLGASSVTVSHMILLPFNHSRGQPPAACNDKDAENVLLIRTFRPTTNRRFIALVRTGHPMVVRWERLVQSGQSVPWRRTKSTICSASSGRHTMRSGSDTSFWL